MEYYAAICVYANLICIYVKVCAKLLSAAALLPIQWSQCDTVTKPHGSTAP